MTARKRARRVWRVWAISNPDGTLVMSGGHPYLADTRSWAEVLCLTGERPVRATLTLDPPTGGDDGK